MAAYAEFLDSKRQATKTDTQIGGEYKGSPLFPFQRELVAWALDRGRAAIFADTGLGKTVMQLEWANRLGGNVLILAPLAVSHQTIAEGERFGIEVGHSIDGHIAGRITITNYQRLHYFDSADFIGVVCDESGILKSFDGATRQAITIFMRQVKYRLLCSATPAPNDYTELGTASEALGELGHMDMLSRYFVNDKRNAAMGRAYGKLVQWRFKGHAEEPFWRWVCSWARAIRRPSDLNGYDDSEFVLPPLEERQHCVESSKPQPGMLFPIEAISLHEQRAERRHTVAERCAKVAELVDHGDPALVWCHLNDEGDLLTRSIPGAVQVAGADSDDVKEARLMAFVRGETRVLVTKPRIAGWGLNFQHCAHMTLFPSHSFEQYYQAVRRCWRYGQKRPVVVDVVTTEAEQRVLRNLEAKAKAADQMFERLVKYMRNSQHSIEAARFQNTAEVPSWL